jgi:vitamin B12/bleomycin/antimicrobial peptide transport system ATP-binding/permease protein
LSFFKDSLRKLFRRSADPGAAGDPVLSGEKKKELKDSTSHMTLTQSMRAAWKLMKPFWTSNVETTVKLLPLSVLNKPLSKLGFDTHIKDLTIKMKEKYVGYGLLTSVVGLTLGLVGLDVLFTNWRGDFQNMLMAYAGHKYDSFMPFMHQIGTFAELATIAVIGSKYNTYAASLLGLHWRKSANEDTKNKFLNDKAYYRLQNVYNRMDNPNQRIGDDLNKFTDTSINLATGFLASSTALVSFAGMLWGLSGTLNTSIMGHPISIPGYMLFAAAAYAGVGSAITHLIGSPLAKMRAEQQRREAVYRKALIRVEDNAESIALYGGEEVEKKTLKNLFSEVVDNYKDILKREKTLGFFTSGHGQAAVLFPYLMYAPRLVTGAFKLGDLSMTAGAFGQVQDALNWFIGSYTTIADYKATVTRLTEFNDAMKQSKTDLDKKIVPATPPAADEQEHLQMPPPAALPPSQHLSPP